MSWQERLQWRSADLKLNWTAGSHIEQLGLEVQPRAAPRAYARAVWPSLVLGQGQRGHRQLENLTRHQDLGRATEGSIRQNYWVLQGGSEILPTLQDLREVCRLPQPLFPLRPERKVELKREVTTANNRDQLSIYWPCQAKPSLFVSLSLDNALPQRDNCDIHNQRSFSGY